MVDELQQTAPAPAAATATAESEFLNAIELQHWEKDPVDPGEMDLREEIIRLNRVAKVVKGGRRFSFSATVVVGNGRGIVGLGKGKAKQVPDAIGKAVEAAKRNMIRVSRVGRTIPHEIVGAYGSARVLLRPAAEGTGVIAGSAVRAVLDLAGIGDALTKSLGSSNVVNVVKATVEALRNLGNAERVARLRGKKVEELVSRKYRAALHQRMRESMPVIKDEGLETRVSAALAAQEAAAEQFGEGRGDGRGYGGESDDAGDDSAEGGR